VKLIKPHIIDYYPFSATIDSIYLLSCLSCAYIFSRAQHQ